LSTLAPTPPVVPLYAGFWRRGAAAVIDGIILVVANIALTLMMANRPVLVFLINLLLAVTYFAWFHSSGAQATPGKRAFGIKVTDVEGERISFLRGAWRYVAMFFSSLILGIGYLMAAFTEKRQALHDIMAGTLVVNRDASPEDIANGGGVMPVTGGVIFVAVVLLLLPVLAGIGAAIAIPAYQDNAKRAMVAEVLSAALPLQEEVAQAMADKRPITTGPMPSLSAHTESLTVLGDGRVVIAVVPKIAPGGKITLEPPVDGGATGWTCSATDIPGKYLPPRCR
jgi:uncharacterized RDD family membrane protein YckC